MARNKGENSQGVSTEDAAVKAKISIATLNRWIAAGKVKSSIEIPLPWGKLLRRWTSEDIEQLSKFADEHLGERKGGRR